MTKTYDIPSSVEETLASREGFYNMLAMFYRNSLTIEQIDALGALDFESLEFDEPLLTKGFDDIRRYLRKRNTGTRQSLATEYTAAFVGMKTYAGKSAIPCASLFVDEEGLFYGPAHREIYNLYKQECVRVDKSLSLPSDHLTFELEFLALMSVECRQALEDGDIETARHKLEVSRSLIENHILKWFEPFEQVASHVIETRFYRGVIRITKGYMLLDLATIAELEEVLSGE